MHFNRCGTNLFTDVAFYPAIRATEFQQQRGFDLPGWAMRHEPLLAAVAFFVPVKQM
jgi:hypothetical protein